MRTWVALLRGINLGDHHKVAMRDLEALMGALGHEDVQTYLRSGNVVFRARSSSADALTAELEAGFEGALGFEVPTLLRTGPELRRVKAGNPFEASGADPAKLHVTFLRDAPSKATVRGLDVATGGDEYDIVGREVYLHCPNGYGRSKLVNPLWERKLDTLATTRNWKTVNALVEMATS
jgi:uncharacterized protein (DUF1697 family)